jgi:hypothetical protein
MQPGPPRAAKESLAGRYQDGESAKDQIETELFDLLGFEFTIRTDEYDNSLEIYLDESAPVDWRAGNELATLIYGFGFNRFWVNWPDGTEQYGTGERRLRSAPTPA